MDLDSMNHEQHSHTPYLVLYVKALEKWRSLQTVSGKLASTMPDNYQKRKEFEKVLLSMRKADEKGSLDEENFAEARTNLISSFGGQKVIFKRNLVAKFRLKSKIFLYSGFFQRLPSFGGSKS
jgi:hypothetical protein